MELLGLFTEARHMVAIAPGFTCSFAATVEPELAKVYRRTYNKFPTISSSRFVEVNTREWGKAKVCRFNLPVELREGVALCPGYQI